jgi:tRNA nucleotidyltransferase (CCA-adding enzyme)
MDEAESTACFAMLHELHVLHCIHPLLQARFKVEQLDAAVHMVRWYSEMSRALLGWKTLLLSLLWPLSTQAADEVVVRLLLPNTKAGELQAQLLAAHEAAKSLVESPGMTTSVMYKLLRPIQLEAVLAILALFKHEGRDWTRLADYMTHWRNAAVAVKGDDLKALGIKPGPLFGKLQAALLEALLDGHVSQDKDDQLKLVAVLCAQWSSQ